jgi:DNA-binding NarL/FixJ family response regulator
MLMPPYRVVVADSQILFLQSIGKNLKETPGLELIGEFGDASELLEFIEKSLPNLVILDVGNRQQIETVIKIKGSHPEVKLLALLTEKSKEFLTQAILARADGYLFKENTYLDLTMAIDKIRQGGRYFCNIISGKMADIICEDMSSTAVGKALSAKQIKVLTLRCEMKSYREIAELLSLKETTVRNYMTNIMNKLKIRNKEDLRKYALEHGYLK